MEEIKVGEYGRTRTGKIVRYVNFINEDGSKASFKLLVENNKPTFNRFYEQIVKSSKNIIDLIEAEDIVIIEYYVSKYKHRIRRKFEVRKFDVVYTFENAHCTFDYDKGQNKWLDVYSFNPKIVGIVTKEQFQNAMYEV